MSQDLPDAIVLISSDKKRYTVPYKATKLSQVITDALDYSSASLGEQPRREVSVPVVEGDILKKVIEWLTYHQEDPQMMEPEIRRADAIPEWDKIFLKSLSQKQLFSLMQAANFMDISKLVEFSTKFVAGMMQSQTPEAIRALFHIKNDFTKEEQIQIDQEPLWANVNHEMENSNE